MKTKWQDLAKSRMKHLGMSQEGLAELMGVTQGAVGHWLNGRREASVEVILELLKAIGFTGVAFDAEGYVTGAAGIDDPQSSLVSLSDRIKFILTRENLRQKDLANQLNTSSQTVNNWLKRNAISRDAAQQISEIYGYSLDWLLNGVGNPKLVVGENQIPDEKDFFPIRTWDSRTPLDNDEVEIPFLKDIEFACGNGSYSEDDYNGFKLRFSKATMRRIGANSDGSGVMGFPARGDSMEPVICNGTTVAVNTADKKIVDGKIYAINQGGLKRIKLLHQTTADKIIIRSYNKVDYPDEEVDASDVEIIGRVFWWAVMDA